MIILVLHEGAQRAVDGVILSGLDLDRNGGQAVVIVDQVINLAFVAVIVIKQLAAVRGQLLPAVTREKPRGSPAIAR